LVRQLFAHWSGAEIGLVMDRTDIEDQWSLLMLAAAFRHRALPLAWRVLPFGGTDADTQIALLQQVQPCLPDPSQVHITLYGDCEFRAVKVQQYCQACHWHWQLGLKSDTLFRQDTADWQPLQQIPVSQGQRCYLWDVTLTQQHTFGPVNLIADWTRDEDAPRYVATDQPADRYTWRQGRKRFWIEPFFRDCLSWPGEELWLRSGKQPTDSSPPPGDLGAGYGDHHAVDGLHRPMGDRDRPRPLLEASHKRDYSIFRLGRDYAFRSQVMGWLLPIGFTVIY
jgi:hypothetical protein